LATCTPFGKAEHLTARFLWEVKILTNLFRDQRIGRAVIGGQVAILNDLDTPVKRYTNWYGPDVEQAFHVLAVHVN
jgi:hypothetical protein